MALTDSRRRGVQEPARRVPGWLGAGAALGGVVVVLVGTWVAGGLLTEDAGTAMVLTGLWFGLCGLAALVALWRWRRAAAPLFLAVAVTVAALGAWLAQSMVDRTVDEDVVTASSGSTAAGAGSGGVVEVASGAFVAQAHETAGTATVLERPDGSRVVTLTGFETDPGPDLRVHLVPAGAGGVDGGVDVGALKGNKGDQQYDVPADAPTGQVVIWCRAFSVAFGSAALQGA